jgi:hypothetical protein
MLQEMYNRLIGVQKSQEQLRNECVWVQVVGEVLGRNSGISLEQYVEERQRQLRAASLQEDRRALPPRTSGH